MSQPPHFFESATTRSTSNLSKVSSLSNTALDTSSQHNKISPIVNSPFEQTFRVTVYLPKNQLYVERIGAKTKLKKLMDDICENKLLQADQYEFRHPGDLSQAFDNEKTIGEVGLNELKLTLKTESRFNGFHANDMMRYKSESVSSSEISRNSKIVLPKTSSPYSSTTSLNSLDSTGMNLTAKMQPPVAPIRKKKRAAPRPPSQNSIPEQEIFSTSTLNVFKDHSISILPRKNFHVSSPHLFNNGTSISNDVTKSDKNNNIEAPENRLNAITRPTSMFVSPSADHAERQRTLSESSEIQDALSNITNSLGKLMISSVITDAHYISLIIQRKRRKWHQFLLSVTIDPFPRHAQFRKSKERIPFLKLKRLMKFHLLKIRVRNNFSTIVLRF